MLLLVPPPPTPPPLLSLLSAGAVRVVGSIKCCITIVRIPCNWRQLSRVWPGQSSRLVDYQTPVAGCGRRQQRYGEYPGRPRRIDNGTLVVEREAGCRPAGSGQISAGRHAGRETVDRTLNRPTAVRHWKRAGLWRKRSDPCDLIEERHMSSKEVSRITDCFMERIEPGLQPRPQYCRPLLNLALSRKHFVKVLLRPFRGYWKANYLMPVFFSLFVYIQPLHEAETEK
jgi:hypothetical protein